MSPTSPLVFFFFCWGRVLSSYRCSPFVVCFVVVSSASSLSPSWVFSCVRWLRCVRVVFQVRCCIPGSVFRLPSLRDTNCQCFLCFCCVRDGIGPPVGLSDAWLLGKRFIASSRVGAFARACIVFHRLRSPLSITRYSWSPAATWVPQNAFPHLHVGALKCASWILGSLSSFSSAP